MVGTPNPLEIGVCSWSLQLVDEPTLRPEIQRFDLRGVHLALGPIVDMPPAQRDAAIAAYQQSPLLLTAGMISFRGEDYHTLHTIHQTGGYVPDHLFEERLNLTLAAAQIAHTLNLKLLTTHAGFIPEKKDAAAFATLQNRLRRIADALAPLGITLCFETGQETANTLADFLTALDRPNIGVNFDPANIILYGKGNPVDAAIRLAPWIKHMHAKDGRTLPPKNDPAAWPAEEVVVGQGDARVADVVTNLYRCGYRGAIAIECERGPTRGKSIALALAILRPVIQNLLGN